MDHLSGTPHHTTCTARLVFGGRCHEHILLALPRSVDTLSVKELYALKSETENRALNARMLASLFEKPPSLAVTVASVTNSPLISQ